MTAKGDHKGINTNKRDEELFRNSSDGTVRTDDDLDSTPDGVRASQTPYLVDPACQTVEPSTDHDSQAADLAGEGSPAVSSGQGEPMTSVERSQEDVGAGDTTECQPTHTTREANAPTDTHAPVVATGTAPEDTVIVHARPLHQPPESLLLYVDNEVLVSQIINQLVAPASYVDPGSVPESSIFQVIGDRLLLVPREQP